MASFQPFGGATKFFAAITFAAGLVVAAGQGITINDGAPSVTTNKLYQVGGALFWNGSAVAGGGGGTGLQMLNSMTTGQIVFAMNTSSGATLAGFTLTTSTNALYLPTDYTLYATNTVAAGVTSTAGFFSSIKVTSGTTATWNVDIFNTAQGTSTILGFVNGSGTFLSVGSLYVSSTIDTAGGLNMTCAGQNCKKTLTLSAAGCNQPAQGPSASSSLVYLGNNVYRTSNFQPLAYNRCQLDWIPPDSWDGGTLVAQFIYAVTTTDNNGVSWGIQGQGMGDGAALATEFSGATATVTLVATTTNALTVSTGTTLTVGGVTSDPYLVKLQLTRFASPGVSTNTALLVGVKLEYGVNRLTD
jgi:hypothetical protein